ncbi:pentatricopeptide repeat-containing protein At1g62670, mitochondrial-like [Aristolochia californica]|uniref:pentatricopeptide repeat-containing protein At1g62670, mitochondrial-like n=1 Tax=Aristolochia californica TaxID=171875 RepID=UPI0035DD8021
MEMLLNEMTKIKRQNKEELAFRFGFLVESFCRSQRVDEALKLFDIMNSAKCFPQISTCNLLLGAFVVKKDLERVIFVYKEMVKVGTVPNVEILNYLMEVLCESGQMDIALEQFRRMQQKHLNPNNCDLYNSVIPLLRKANKLDEGTRLYRVMRGACLLPNLAVYTLVGACCEIHQLDEAIKLLGLNPGIQMYVDVVNGYCQLGKFADAETFLDVNSVSEASPYNALIEGYYKRC